MIALNDIDRSKILLSFLAILIILIPQESFAQEVNSCENGRIQHWDKIVFEIIDDKNNPMVIPADYLGSKLDIRVVATGGIVNAELYIKQSLQEQFELNETQSDNVGILVDDILYDVITCMPDPEKDPLEFLKHPLFLLVIGGIFTGIMIPWFNRMMKKRDKIREDYKQTLERKQKICNLIVEMISDFNGAIEMLDIMGDDKDREKDGKKMANSLFKQNLTITFFLQTEFKKYAFEWVPIGRAIQQLVDIYSIWDESKLLEKWKSDDEMVTAFTEDQMRLAISNLKNTKTRKNLTEKLKHDAITLIQKIIDDP